MGTSAPPKRLVFCRSRPFLLTSIPPSNHHPSIIHPSSILPGRAEEVKTTTSPSSSSSSSSDRFHVFILQSTREGFNLHLSEVLLLPAWRLFEAVLLSYLFDKASGWLPTPCLCRVLHPGASDCKEERTLTC